uniref:Uncharacterized protein n=1 Tax=Fundulus heteroclitus TaxID=8078 RepID=A0A3Q2PD89_FUNHE
MSLLENWCTGEGLDAFHALVVKHVPIETTVKHIEETLTIKVLGRVKVRGHMFNPQLQSLMVLCECSERVNTKTIPLDVPPIEGGELWTLHGPADEEKVNPEKRQTDPLPQDSSTSTEEAAAPDRLSSGAMPGNSPESIIRAIGDLLGKTMKPAKESNIFRCLLTYSGAKTWMEQAQLMVDESDCSIREKRKRIVESLKGPENSARVDQLLRGTTESEIMLLQLRLKERKRDCDGAPLSAHPRLIVSVLPLAQGSAVPGAHLVPSFHTLTSRLCFIPAVPGPGTKPDHFRVILEIAQSSALRQSRDKGLNHFGC